MKKLNFSFMSDNKAVPDVVTGAAPDLEAAAEKAADEVREELEDIIKDNPKGKKHGLKLNLDTVAVPEVNIDLLKKLK